MTNNELDMMHSLAEVLVELKKWCELQMMQNSLIKSQLVDLTERIEKSEKAQPHMKNNDPEIDKLDDQLTYYVTTCSNCGNVSPVGNYCIWCGEKDTCLGEGGDHE